jgi:hypothetical protein
MGYISEKEVNFLYKTLLFGGLFFLLMFSFYAIKSNNDDVCTNTYFNNDPSINNLLIINEDNYSFSFDIDKKSFYQVKEQIVCFDIGIKTNNYISLNIGINDYNNIFYEYNYSGVKCYDLSNVSQKGYLTFSCNNCDINNNVTLKKSSDNYITLINNNPSINDSVYYKIINIEHCNKFLKNLVKYYFSFLGVLSLVFLIINGLNWFKKMVFEGW